MTDFSFTSGNLELIEFVIQDFEKTIMQSNLNVIIHAKIQERAKYTLWSCYGIQYPSSSHLFNICLHLVIYGLVVFLVLGVFTHT